MSDKSSAPGKPVPLYVIPTHEDEQKRLGLQHTVIVRHFGWHIHPRINIKPDAEILEVATGTGIWPVEVAKMLPGVKIQATDINNTYFPNPENTPPNVTFSVQSVLELPQEWSNKFDLIHQRLLICGLSTENWRTALRELYRVTKPGGWIQLIEIDAQAMRPRTGPGGKKLLEWLQDLMNQTGLVVDAVDRVEGHVKAAGFENFTKEMKLFTKPQETEVSKANLGADTIRSQLNYFRHMKPRIVSAGIVSDEEYTQAEAELQKEWEASDDIANAWFVYCAQKPL
jgi:ubiquinone/menaquinone biosynthesis C-methylase UbiE